MKSELLEVRELIGVLVSRESSAETRAEIAARRLDRMEREKDEVEDAEYETSVEEALTNMSKVAKMIINKWFVDKGFGLGKVQTSETVVIHASAVHGPEVLTIDTDAWVQVVTGDARAQEGHRASLAWDRTRGERDKERANSAPASETSRGPDGRTRSSVREQGLRGMRPPTGPA